MIMSKYIDLLQIITGNGTERFLSAGTGSGNGVKSGLVNNINFYLSKAPVKPIRHIRRSQLMLNVYSIPIIYRIFLLLHIWGQAQILYSE